MRLINDQGDYEKNRIIINGDGTYPDLLILKRICEIYNGPDRIIVYPRTPKKTSTGLSALRSIYRYIDEGYRNLIFIADREHISQDENTEIKNQLSNINFLDERQIEKAFFYEYQLGNRIFNLYCNISGLENCVEENLLNLMKLQMNIQPNLPPVRRDAEWRKQLKAEIKKHANRKQIKELLNRTGRNKFEATFPSLCALFKEIERLYEL